MTDSVHGTYRPVVSVERDGEGGIVSVARPSAGGVRQSLVHCEVRQITDAIDKYGVTVWRADYWQAISLSDTGRQKSPQLPLSPTRSLIQRMSDRSSSGLRPNIRGNQ